MLESEGKKRAFALGARIVLTFLAAFGFLVVAVYFILSRNFQTLMSDYSIKLIEAMVNQGVTTVDYELHMSRWEVVSLAESFTLPDGEKGTVAFPKTSYRSDVLRVVFISKNGTVYASDKRQLDGSDRPDIAEALAGEPSVYGPYFNEESEYVICFTAPVLRDGAVVGALSVEKDGYRYCKLIEGITFADSGESYIIDADGTDIAVSNMEHIDWVQSGYNARKILDEQEDPVTRSIAELEQKGLDGETGTGTYQWEGSLCYVTYAPIPSTGWVLLTGVREEELASMTQTTLLATIAHGPALEICIIVFLLLMGLVVWWIILSMKKTAEMNEQLKIMANYDALTGILNRNSYHAALDALSEPGAHTLACIYVDTNGLHEINNHLGHKAGDVMLKAVADALREAFAPNDVYRIGGDEFVALCKDLEKQDVTRRAEQARTVLKERGYEISVGVEWRSRDLDILEMVGAAEAAMQENKRRFFQSGENDRRLRAMDKKLEQMIVEKQDADEFLKVLAAEFKGVYFVDLGRDTIRHLYIPPYFEEFLRETDDKFSRALLAYAHEIVEPQYLPQFERVCDYTVLEKDLDGGMAPEFIYQKTNGDWLKLRILKFKDYTQEHRETLWIFSNVPGPAP